MTLTTTLICMAIITIAFVRCCKMAIGNKQNRRRSDRHKGAKELPAQI